MSEVEKMYENCNIKPKKKGYCDWDSNCPYPHHKCNDECPYWKYEDEAKYPPFIAEKQLFLFQWICKRFKEIYVSHTDFEEVQSWEIVYKISVHRNSFEECLCAFINLLWQDLTEEEKQQVKGVLE